MATFVVGTVRGLYKVTIDAAGAASVQPAGGPVLQKAWICNVAVSAAGTALAAVMKMSRVHSRYDKAAAEANANAGHEGVWIVDAAGGERRLVEGDAKACAISEDPRFKVMYAGFEPAAVSRSTDGGASWRRLEALQRVPSRPQWTFPVPPHEAHVLSLDLLPTWDASQAPGKDLLVGIEVGGVFRSGDAGDSFSEHNGPALRGKEDVHSVRPDPHKPNRWYCVTGYGFFRTEDAGGSWARVSTGAGGYCVGLSLCPATEDLLAVTSAASPPGVGSAALAVSRDAGRSFAPVEGGPFDATPVPLWVGRELYVGDIAGPRGTLYRLNAAGRRLERLCELPAGVTCMAAPGGSPSSVMH